jgi:hypothetical protein
MIKEINTAFEVAIPGLSISNIFGYSLGIGAVIAFVIIVYAGLLYSTSMGNAGIQSDAKARIRAALTGLVILATGFLLLNTINPEIVGSSSSNTVQCP